VSAHYDHLGINPLLDGDQIFNGAADDGSGTVATLELAQVLMNAKRDGHGPRRSILFANFTGEEVGMFGSLFYTNKNPGFPLEQTVANINMDGVGGTDHKNPTGSKDYVYITGRQGLSEELLEINEKITKLIKSSLKLTDGAKMNFSSDDAQFGDQHIPYIYYSTGRTEHYHTINDTPDTIDYPHMTRIVQLVLANIWQVANQDERISSVDRKTLSLAGYSCLPCNLSCDTVVHKQPGNCPFCGHSLVPKLVKTRE
jgi:Zn-dependent M28 family amino/carboxypeptidase